MEMKKITTICSITLAVILSCADLFAADMNPIYRFKGLNIPVSLKIEDKILENGVYDLEFCRVPSTKSYFVRIMKRGRVLEVVQGDDFPYGGTPDRDIPKKPTLKMNINKDKKVLALVFESGIWTSIYPKIRARFEIPYQE